MSSATRVVETLDDLYRTEGKAELIGGRIICLGFTGRKPSRIASHISRSLDDYAEATGLGVAYGGNIGFAVALLPSGRQSFSPDASYWGVSSNGTGNWNSTVTRRVFPQLRGRNQPVFPRIPLELDV